VSPTCFAHYELPDRGDVVLGRSESCDLTIDDPSVSRRHAVLHVDADVDLEDLGSANGTRVRGRPVDPSRAAAVVNGDEIRIGNVLVIVQDAGDDALPRPTADDVATHRADLASHELRKGGAASPGPDRVVVDPQMRELYALVDRLAVGSIAVCVVGETGAGKEIVAERLHQHSPRRDHPFMRLNCAALAESLVEAELFGHERGAFTGAQQGRPGLLEAADGGTVFLDEVGEMPQTIQAKMLRVLEAGEVLRVGARAPRPIDVRFVAATNRDLEREVAEGRFRRDLLYRLSGAVVHVPPLRERPSEIAALARAFVESACRGLGRPPLPLRADAVALLERYTWPGNVRELKNAVERAVLVATGSELAASDFPIGEMAARLPLQPLGARAVSASVAPPSAPPPSDDAERARILQALNDCGGNQSRAAKVLGIARSTLVSRLDDYGVPRPRKPPSP
jgi:DNA-binding NtrC family response regulator